MDSKRARELVAKHVGASAVNDDRVTFPREIIEWAIKVAPRAVEIAVTLVDTDLAKSDGPAQRAAGRVEREDARDELPIPALTRRGDEPPHQLLPHAAPVPLGRDVHRELGDAAIVRGNIAISRDDRPHWRSR